ncbi:MAG: PorV/PorQ family protein, partial [bacterium]|nr:PorV/PorQ family protein [bacterium]
MTGYGNKMVGKILFLMSMIFIPLHPLLCQNGLGFLNMAADARNASLSGSDLVRGAGVNDMNFNPALLLNIQRNSLFLSHSEWMEMKNMGLGFARRLKPGVAGLYAAYQYDTSVIKTDIYGNDQGEMKVYNLIIKAGFARNFINKNSGAGMNIKYILSVLDEYKAQSVCADIGGIYRPGWLKDRIGFGLGILNLGLPLKYKDEKAGLPVTFQAGVSYQVLGLPEHRVFLYGSGCYNIHDLFTLPLGIEYNFFRIGYGRISYLLASENARSVSFGLGVIYKRFSVGAAYIPGAGADGIAYNI